MAFHVDLNKLAAAVRDSGGFRRGDMIHIEAAIKRAAVATAAANPDSRWVHDEPGNPFHPHVRLHHAEAADPSDYAPYHVGDHQGCLCHIEPLPVRPTEMRSHAVFHAGGLGIARIHLVRERDVGLVGEAATVVRVPRGGSGFWTGTSGPSPQHVLAQIKAKAQAGLVAAARAIVSRVT